MACMLRWVPPVSPHIWPLRYGPMTSQSTIAASQHYNKADCWWRNRATQDRHTSSDAQDGSACKLARSASRQHEQDDIPGVWRQVVLLGIIEYACVRDRDHLLCRHNDTYVETIEP